MVSIKENKSAAPLRALEDPPDGDGITLSNLSLFDIMRWNFNIRSFREDQLVGVPGWFTNERFDIQAKVADTDVAAWRKLTEPYRRLVFRKLVVEQFKLAAHWANVEQADYNLVIAKGGLKIKPVKEGDPNPDAPKGADGTPIKGNGIFLIDRSPSGLKFAFQETHLGWFAKGFLPSYAGRQAYDKTGIPDETIYNFTLQFAPERSTAPVMPGADAGEASEPPPESGPSIFTALPGTAGSETGTRQRPRRPAGDRPHRKAGGGLAVVERHARVIVLSSYALRASPRHASPLRDSPRGRRIRARHHPAYGADPDRRVRSSHAHR